MPGILSSNGDAKIESDCIVTAMFLGVAMERGKELNVAYGFKKDPTGLKNGITKVNAALKSANPKHKDLQIVEAPAWKQGNYITAGFKTELNLKDLSYAEAGKVKEQYEGPGAYTGMVFVKNELKYWGSTFEYNIGGKRKFANPVKFDTLNMQKQGGGKLVGYVHGMIQAMYVSHHYGSLAGAKVIELMAGKVTTKQASCFACTTFMLANNRKPDFMHLGEGVSWAPVDPNNEFALAQLTGDRCSTELKDKPKDMKDDVIALNKTWVANVGNWLTKGAQIGAENINETHKAAWALLQKKYTKDGKGNAGAADDFLDALGAHHTDDFTRIYDTLK